MTSESILSINNYVEDQINNMTPYNKRKFYLFEKIILFFVFLVHRYNLYHLSIPIFLILPALGFLYFLSVHRV